MDKLIKWGYFIVYTEEILAKDIAKIYIKEVFIRYRALSKIILDRDLRYILGGIFSRIRGLSSNITYILPIDR